MELPKREMQIHEKKGRGERSSTDPASFHASAGTRAPGDAQGMTPCCSQPCSLGMMLPWGELSSLSRLLFQSLAAAGRPFMGAVQGYPGSSSRLQPCSRSRRCSVAPALIPELEKGQEQILIPAVPLCCMKPNTLLASSPLSSVVGQRHRSHVGFLGQGGEQPKPRVGFTA